MKLTIGTKYLFDTSLFIDSLRGNREHKKSAQWIIFQARDMRVSAGYSIISQLELWAGIRGFWTEEQHEDLLRPFRRYPLLVRTTKRAGLMRATLASKGENGPKILDCVIAATAEYYKLNLVTSNVGHFELISSLCDAKLKIEDYT